MIGWNPTTLEELLGQLAHDQDDETVCEAHAGLALLKTTSMERVLGSLLDPASFYVQYVPTRYDFAEGLKKAYQRMQMDNYAGQLDGLRGAIGLVCFILELLSEAGHEMQTPPSVKLEWPRELISDPAVRAWFYEIYKPKMRRNRITNQSGLTPQEKKNLELSQKFWRELDLESLNLYQVGTTSFILRCQIRTLPGEQLVLKCLLFPYTRVALISDATRDYALNYVAGIVPATARVRSSTSKWVLMDFIEGVTLREFLHERRNSEGKTPPSLRTDVLASLGMPLLDVLCALSSAGFQHEDLTPSNIIVVLKADRSVEKVVLIDLGRNYLYMHKTGLAENRETLFVAPEVRDGKSASTSDLYSFGILLIEIVDPKGVKSAMIPDSIYQYAQPLARFIEDLIDIDPEKRLLIFGSKDKGDLSLNVRRAFADVSRVLPSNREMQPGAHLWVQQIMDLFFPSHQLERLRELWRMTQSPSTHPEIAKYSSRLFGWLVACTINWNIIFTICFLWGLRDFGVDAFPTFISIAQKLIPNCSDCVPVLDWFRAPGYVIHDIQANLPARLTLFSVMAQTKYYQNILAGLTTKPMRGTLARVTEVTLRYCAVASLVPILISNLYQPSWWLILLASSFIVASINNVLCYWLATRTLKLATGVLSTVSPSDDHPLQAFGSWGPNLLIYSLFLLGIWIGLQTHFLHDEWIYIIATVMISVFALCVTKSIYLAPSVRGSLHRAFISGERLEAAMAHYTTEVRAQEGKETHPDCNS